MKNKKESFEEEKLKEKDDRDSAKKPSYAPALPKGQQEYYWFSGEVDKKLVQAIIESRTKKDPKE